MSVYEAIRRRRSIRTYQEQAVPEEVLARILEAARMAPSGRNRQPWKFVMVTDKEIRKKLGEAANNQDFVGEAPVIITAVGLDPEHMMACGIPGDPVDVAIAIGYMTLAAVEEGLGTCWIGSFSQEKVREILRIPSFFKVIALLTLGYTADSPGAKVRKSLQEIVCYDKFS